jgi:hypothetical protein
MHLNNFAYDEGGRRKLHEDLLTMMEKMSS